MVKQRSVWLQNNTACLIITLDNNKELWSGLITIEFFSLIVEKGKSNNKKKERKR